MDTVQDRIDKITNHVRNYLIKNYPLMAREFDFEKTVLGVTDLYLRIPENNRRDSAIPWALKAYFDERSKAFNQKLSLEEELMNVKQQSNRNKFYESTLQDEMFNNEEDTIADIQGRHLYARFYLVFNCI